MYARKADGKGKLSTFRQLGIELVRTFRSEQMPGGFGDGKGEPIAGDFEGFGFSLFG
jgi:hypothetical protein